MRLRSSFRAGLRVSSGDPDTWRFSFRRALFSLSVFGLLALCLAPAAASSPGRARATVRPATERIHPYRKATAPGVDAVPGEINVLYRRGASAGVTSVAAH